MKTVVVTGATGVIGRALINLCIKKGYDVLAVVHRQSERTKDLELIDHCKVMYLNLSEYNYALDEIKKQNIHLVNFEYFIHLAWMSTYGEGRDNVNSQLDNIQASLQAVQFAKNLGCSTFVGIGSQAEYGRIDGMLTPTTPAFPETGYGIAKLCAGQMTRLLCNQLDIKHIWCRVLSVYGPYDRDQTLISTAVSKMLANETTEFSPCNQLWDYIYSEDAAKAILCCAQNGKDGSIYVIGSGEVHQLKEYIQIIARLTGYKKEIGFGLRSYNENQVMYLQADTSSLQDVGFETETTFNEGILKVIEYMINKSVGN